MIPCRWSLKTDRMMLRIIWRLLLWTNTSEYTNKHWVGIRKGIEFCRGEKWAGTVSEHACRTSFRSEGTDKSVNKTSRCNYSSSSFEKRWERCAERCQGSQVVSGWEMEQTQSELSKEGVKTNSWEVFIFWMPSSQMISQSSGDSCHHFLEPGLCTSQPHNWPFLPGLPIPPWVWVGRNFGEVKGDPRGDIIIRNLRTNAASDSQTSIPT